MPIMQTPDPSYISRYNNGNIFPKEMSFMVNFGVLFVAFIFWNKEWIIPVVFAAACSPIIFNRNYVEVNRALGDIRNYTVYLGFIRFEKKMPLAKLKYVSALPRIESIRKNTARNLTSSSSVETRKYSTVRLFGDRLKPSFFIAQFEEHSEALELAKELAKMLHLTYFSYDPNTARSIMLGEIVPQPKDRA